jgi:hypothetical protein
VSTERNNQTSSGFEISELPVRIHSSPPFSPALFGDLAKISWRLPALHDEIELLLIDAERQGINELFRSGKLHDEARRRIERELDLREASLANQRAEE